MKVNPVTGKMEAMEPRKEGEIRDGSLRLPAKYLTAALDAGLGGSNGMYGHMGSLDKVRGVSSGVTKTAPGRRSPRDDDEDDEHAHHVIKQMVQGSMRSVSASGPAKEKRMGDDVHFNKRAGVVNTIGGAKDFSRLTNAAGASGLGAAAPLRKSAALRTGGVHTLASSYAAESGGSARPPRAGSAPEGEKRGIHTFSQLEHDSKVGLRKGDGVGGGAGASVTSGGGHVGGLGGVVAIAPTKKPPKASSVATGARALDTLAAPRAAPLAPRSLGSGTGTAGASAGAGAGSVAGLSDREKRLAYFDAKAK